MAILAPERAQIILKELTRLYPEVETELDFEGPLQLVVATILSAQCTDVRVNQVTPGLFAKYPDVYAFAQAKQKELETVIHSTGFFRAKARNIIACCEHIVEHHHGEVPASMEELVALPGIGRKTANVILGNAFDIPGIPVDTHVGRLSYRMGLTRKRDPVKVEQKLMKLIPEEEWTNFGHRMIFHGRRVCHAIKPHCQECTLKDICPKVGVNKKKKKKQKKKQ